MGAKRLIVLACLSSVVLVGCTVNWKEMNNLVRRGNSAYLVISSQLDTVKTIHAKATNSPPTMLVSFLSFRYDATVTSLRAGDYLFADVSPDGKLTNIAIAIRAKGIRERVRKRLDFERTLALQDLQEMADLERRLEAAETGAALFGVDAAHNSQDILRGLVNAIRAKRPGWHD
jgi:hypothetical protein